MKLSFEQATNLLLKQGNDAMEVYIEVHYTSPMGIIIPVLGSAPGINDTERTILSAKLSEDKTSLLLPVTVASSELNEFCAHLKQRIPYMYLQGVFLSEENVLLQEKPRAIEAANTVLNHYYKA